MITKHASNIEHCHHPVRYYERARNGMYDFLRALRQKNKLDYILLPSYIGYSPKDGSGVYDPVAQVQGLKYEFYHVDLMLQIDMASVRTALESIKGQSFVLLRMDYYGFTDSNAEALYQLVHEYGGYVLEDNAHSIPDSRDIFGFWSDAVFYAMHKFLPLPKGGMLMLRHHDVRGLELTGGLAPEVNSNLWEYDFSEIARIRRRNFESLEECCKQYAHHFTSMRTLQSDETTTPYSFPVILKHDDRFSLYNFLNEHGYGVTCLYYSIIEQIPTSVYPESEYLSNHILNFSIHQDVDAREYPAMLALIDEYYNGSGNCDK